MHAYRYARTAPDDVSEWEWALPRRAFNRTLSAFAHEAAAEATARSNLLGVSRRGVCDPTAFEESGDALARAGDGNELMRPVRKRGGLRALRRPSRRSSEAHTSDGHTSEAHTSDGHTSDGHTSDGHTSDGHTRVERLERPQLLFSTDRSEPTHAYLAVLRNGYSMNVAVPLGSSETALRGRAFSSLPPHTRAGQGWTRLRAEAVDDGPEGMRSGVREGPPV